jgi:hypothetical protein
VAAVQLRQYQVEAGAGALIAECGLANADLGDCGVTIEICRLSIGIVDWDCRLGLSIFDWDCRLWICAANRQIAKSPNRQIAKSPNRQIAKSPIANRQSPIEQIVNPNRKSTFSIVSQQSLKSAIASRQSAI